MHGIEQLFWVLFLNLQLSIWSIDGERSCTAIYVKRDSKYTASVGDTFKLECPVKYCTHRPNVTWCKFKGNKCLSLGDEGHLSWEEKENTSVFVLHFDQVFASDNGSYRCSVNLTTEVMESHSVVLYVRERIQNNSEQPLITLADISDTSASRPPSKEEIVNKQWIIICLAPLGGLPLLIVCLYFFCCLRRHHGGFHFPFAGKQKKPGSEGRGINLADVSQNFRSGQIEVDTSQISQALSPEIGIYDNDSQFRDQEESWAYSNPCLEEKNHGIVYASLNHSAIAVNSRKTIHVKETPTEYAAICVRS